MIYKKPSDVRYVDMCIWIDEHAYEKDCDEELLFQYLYFIAIMLAHKAKYFNNTKDYEDFAVYMASRAYFRLKNPKQYQTDENGNLKMTKLKSILNYMKSILYPCKVDFQQQYYAQTSVVADDDYYHSEYAFADKLSDTVDELSAVDFKVCLNDITKTIRAFLKQIPYKQGTAEWHNIHMSCLLSFLNSITLTNYDINRIKNYTKNRSNKLNALIALYEAESKDFTILFHLDESMRDYITVLVREIKRVVALDLSYQLRTYVPSSQNSANSVLAVINGEINWNED